MSRTLPDLLEASVRRDPEALAVVHGQGRISYGRLWERVVEFSRCLIRGGLARGDRVALLLENSPGYVAAYYGILRAGGIAVPLNTAAKAVDIRKWLDHCEAGWLIADASHPEFEAVRAGSPAACRVLAVDADGRPADARVAGGDDTGAAEAAAGLDPDDPASIIYTSGTTGDARGVTLSHRNLCSNVASILAYLKLSAGDRIVNVLPFHYSYGNSVLHTHLAAGAALVLENGLSYPHQVMLQLQNERATGFSGVPSTYALLLNRVNPRDYELSALRYLTQAGGRMSPALTERVLQAFPGADLFVMYGQTEATARISYLAPERLRDKMGSVGAPIPGVTVEIRDERGVRVPVGAVGEIWVSGDNVMLGYWRNEPATRSVLRDGWLRTGDLAHVDGDGHIFIRGRNADMIKSGANRISPEEIEEVIAELPGVEEVAVVGVADDLLGEVIKAFVVPRAGRGLSARDVQRHCRERLAIYKIPKHVEFIAALPKTASGKLRRFMLTESEEGKAEPGRQTVPPRP